MTYSPGDGAVSFDGEHENKTGSRKSRVITAVLDNFINAISYECILIVIECVYYTVSCAPKKLYI